MGNCLRKRVQQPAVAAEVTQPSPEKEAGGAETAPPGCVRISEDVDMKNPTFLTNDLEGEKNVVEPDRTLTTSTFSIIPEEQPIPVPRKSADKDVTLAFSNLYSFPYNVLRAATNKFHPSNLLGEGGFGQVYRGWIDSYTLTAARQGEGLRVAIKNLRRDGPQGHSEWLTELTFLSKVDHPNIVKLLGYCYEGDQRMLVYEFMPRGSLERYLTKESGLELSWGRRVNIAAGAAKALAYLHQIAGKPVIHRDLKSSNILLDSDYNAKLSDFGLARLGPQGDRTHVTTRVLGTRGYFAPEYIITGHLTLMTDVYSFGVVLLEILSGSAAMRKYSNGALGDLAVYARPLLDNTTELQSIIDRRLSKKIKEEEAREFAKIIRDCIDINPKNRPAMTQVVEALEKLQHA